MSAAYLHDKSRPGEAYSFCGFFGIVLGYATNKRISQMLMDAIVIVTYEKMW